jgi:hypothetical protein
MGFSKKNLREEDVFRFSSKLVVGREGRLEVRAWQWAFYGFRLGWDGKQNSARTSDVGI